MCSLDKIFDKTVELLKVKPLNGKKIVITSGGTIEDIDPVRYISNYSSGKMGLALADVAKNFGADVTLSGHYHGGVVGFGNRGLVSPDFRLFPKNCHGCCEKDGHYRIVSAGCGEHTISVRLHNPRELVVLEIDGSGEGK